MDRKITALGIIIIALALFTEFARAVEVTGNCDFTGYQCSVNKRTLNVCNDKGHAITFLAGKEGSKANWLSPVPEEFVLNAGECRQATIFMSSDCYAEPGKYLSKIVIKGDGTTKVECTMEINQGHIVDIAVTPQKQVKTQCESANYEINLTNNSRTKQAGETLSIRIKGLSAEWIDLEQTEVFVPTGESKAIKLKVNPPCDAKLDAYAFTAEAVSKANPDFKYTDNAELTLTQGQSITITTEKNYAECREENSTIKFKVKNNGKLADNITLSIDAPSWVSLNKAILSLGRGEEKEIELKISRNNEKTGNHEVKITAESQYNYSTYAKSTINLEDCYAISMEKESGPETACSVDKPEYVFNIENNGKKEIKLAFAISGIDSALDKTEAAIPAGKSTRLKAIFDISRIKEQKKDINFTVSAKSGYESIEKEFSIEAQNCHDLYFKLPQEKICREITGEQEIIVKNYGTKAENAEISLQPNWIALQTSTLSIGSGETKKIKITTTPPEHATDKEIVLSVQYGGKKTEKSKAKINFGSQSYCFGLEVKAKEKVLDAAKCIGKTQEIRVTNTGAAAQNIELKTNKDWIYFENNKMHLESNETKKAYFVIVPPIDIEKGAHTITILAKGQYGSIAYDEIMLNVFGPEFGKGTLDVNIHDVNVTKLIENLNVDIEAQFRLLNESNRTTKIYSITSPNYKSLFIPKETIIRKTESTSVSAYIELPENYDKNKVKLNIDINTDEGIIKKTIEFNLLLKDADGNKEQIIPIKSGLVTFANAAATSIAIIAIIAIAAGIYLAGKNAGAGLLKEVENKKNDEAEKEKKETSPQPKDLDAPEVSVKKNNRHLKTRSTKK